MENPRPCFFRYFCRGTDIRQLKADASALKGVWFQRSVLGGHAGYQRFLFKYRVFPHLLLAPFFFCVRDPTSTLAAAAALKKKHDQASVFFVSACIIEFI